MVFPPASRFCGKVDKDGNLLARTHWGAVLLGAVSGLFVMVVAYLVCIAGSVATAVAAIAISERRAEEWPLVFWSPFLPIFKEYLRWVRLKAVLCEIFHIHYEDPFLPDSAWRCAPRW